MKAKKNISLPQQGKSIIALLTDFGTEDHYVAAMKGRILSINPSAVIIDITHAVEPHNVRQGGTFYGRPTVFSQRERFLSVSSIQVSARNEIL